MLAREGRKDRWFAETDLVKFIDNRLMAPDLQSFAEGSYGVSLLTGKQVDASGLIIVLRIVRFFGDGIPAEEQRFLILPPFFRQAISQTGFYPGGWLDLKGVFKMHQGDQRISLLQGADRLVEVVIG